MDEKFRRFTTWSATVAIVFTLALVAPPAANAQGPNDEDMHTSVEEYLRERTAQTRTPGASYAIVSSDGIESMDAWGTSSNGNPVTTETNFLWGSVAKPVTSAAVMQLVDDGRLDLDDPVKDHLDYFTVADAEAAERITVRHLLDQTSGLPIDTLITDRFGDYDDPYSEAVADLANVELDAQPGQRHIYTSANYLVLGAMIEQITGESFADHVHSQFLRTMMDSPILDRPAASRLDGGHSYAFGQPVSVKSPFDEAGASYGYMGGTITDLAGFAKFVLNEGSVDGQQVVATESVATMLEGSAEIHRAHMYGLGWRDDERNRDLGTSTYWHNGAVPGYTTFIAVMPEHDTAIVIMQNIFGHFQDVQLLQTSLNATRIAAGGEAGPDSGRATYASTLAILAVVLLGFATILAWSIRRLTRPLSNNERRWLLYVWTIGWALVGSALTWAILWFPTTMGVRLAMVRMVAPDMGWMLTSLAAIAAMVALAWLVGGSVRLYRLRPSRVDKDFAATEPRPG
ncbi:serine hydrolase domain-containing protein [Natronoglycomyces albus]|uniref:Beta-lactamase family protein n=1 Tax=Natronoglycomyces albus TaxID=2811108 RepID=A0A895XRZ9_9ACTN|nr:serine hydrolase domain-containing protein [Natronoglycomyces albus]QSB05336.1 beta-lactamase family protein [Natronoglycomyces albus]